MFGNGDLSFFRNIVLDPEPSIIPVFLVADPDMETNVKKVYLEAGEVHGIHEGKKLVLYPFHSHGDEGPSVRNTAHWICCCGGCGIEGVATA